MNAEVQEMKQFMEKRNVPVWGIAAADVLEQEPSGYRPSDILPEAKQLLCIGLPIPRGIFKAASGSLGSYWRTANIYYRNIDATLLQACQIIEKQGNVALPIFGWFPYHIKGPGDLRGFMSLVRMAEAAKIGKIGKNGLLLHAEYGPRLILGGIVTTAEFSLAEQPLRTTRGCPEDCFICQEQCPINAIKKDGRVDRLACVKHSMKSPIFSYLMHTKAFDHCEAEMLNHVTAVDDHSAYTCIQCVSACPYC